MFGIIDIRYGDIATIGVLRGKSMTIENALKKSKQIFSHLQKYEDNISPFDLEIRKLVGMVKLGATIEHSQTTGFPT
jgi:hypothetical protein